MAWYDAINGGPPIYITNLNPDSNNDGQRDAGPFFNYDANPPGSDGVPFYDGQQTDQLVILEQAERIDYLGPGISTIVPAGGLTFSTRDAFIDTGTAINYQGAGGFTVSAGRTLGIREGANLPRPLRNNGSLAPGLQLGLVTVQSFRQDPGASLEIQLAGTTVDTHYDRLAVTGGALLGGDLDVSLLGGFTPTAGNTFTVLAAAGGIVDTFQNFNLPQLSAGLVWDISQTSTALNLAVYSADFNRNGVVDMADYVLWRNTRNTGVGTPHAGADADGNQFVNDADYVIWRSNLGNTSGTAGAGGEGLSAAGVPEPSTAPLVILWGSLLALGRRYGRPKQLLDSVAGQG
jgi:hypothetical protein